MLQAMEYNYGIRKYELCMAHDAPHFAESIALCMTWSYDDRSEQPLNLYDLREAAKAVSAAESQRSKEYLATPREPRPEIIWPEKVSFFQRTSDRFDEYQRVLKAYAFGIYSAEVDRQYEQRLEGLRQEYQENQAEYRLYLEAENEAIAAFGEYQQGTFQHARALERIGKERCITPKKLASDAQIFFETYHPSRDRLPEITATIAAEDRQRREKKKAKQAERKAKQSAVKKAERQLQQLQEKLDAERAARARSEAASEKQAQRVEQTGQQLARLEKQLKQAQTKTSKTQRKLQRRRADILKRVREHRQKEVAALQKGSKVRKPQRRYRELMDAGWEQLRADVVAGERPVENDQYFFETVEELLETPEFAEEFGLK